MVSYNNSVIYKIQCNDKNIKGIYIGSTTNFNQRKYRHKYCCNNKSSNSHEYKIYQFIRHNKGWDNFNMSVVKRVNCKNKPELIKHEKSIIKTLNPSLNSKV